MLILLSNASFVSTPPDPPKGEDRPDWLNQLSGLPTFVNAIEELGTARYNGVHHLAGPPLLLHRLADTQGLSDRARQGLRDAARWSQVALPIARQTLPRIEIVSAPVDDPPTSIFPIPWSALAEASWLQMAAIAGENIDDAKYFISVARAWCAYAQRADSPAAALVAGACIQLEAAGLGGTTASQFVEGPLSARRPVLAVVDSDRPHPAAGLGKTAKRIDDHCRNVWPRTPPPRAPFHVTILPAHAVENLLPVHLVQALEGKREVPDRDVLETNRAAGLFCRPDGVPPALRYIPLKKGDHCPRKLLDVPDPATRRHRNEAISAMAEHRRAAGRPADPSAVVPECIESCTTNQAISAQCAWVRSVGTKLLPAVVAEAEAMIKAGRAADLADQLPFGKDNDWDRLAELVALWGLGRRRAYA